MTDTAEFKLFNFQQDAAEALRNAALRWVEHAARTHIPRYGSSPIPFVGQLRAVTGSGKTPILASAVSGLGDGVILWTSKSSAVVEQTYINLRSRYAGLLGQGDIRIVREIPSRNEWRDLIDARKGLTIWVLTTASWNEAESASQSGSSDARLNLHRPQLDWAGDTSPWEQLRSQLNRPLWIVSDESHNQSAVQLDQLAALKPMGFFMASATPVQNELFDAWQKALGTDSEWRDISQAARVHVRTTDVVDADLLKTTIEVVDFNSGTEESLDGALATLQQLEKAAEGEGTSVNPRAIYVVEKSNPPRGSTEEARPLFIWRYLRQRGVPVDQIAVYTDTRDLPAEAEKISSLSRLQPRHRHIIFNQSLQEGWDDPEAYVAYFDGVTRSFVRIRQIVGRVLRQPSARRFQSELLNTATLILNTPAESYDKVISELRAELCLYAPDSDPAAIPIRVKTRKDPLPPVSLKEQWEGKLTLPRWALRAPDMGPAEQTLRSRGASPWAPEFLEAPGVGRRSIVSLQEDGAEQTEYINVLRSARTSNMIFLRRRMASKNRACLNAIHPDAITGLAFEQFSCQGSQAQQDLIELAGRTADYFEQRVEYEADPDPDLAYWTLREHRPRSRETVSFANSAHPEYCRADFNSDELAFAQALDLDSSGVWARNPSASDLGFHIPLVAKVGESTRFFPDFLWWVDEKCWAIDTTGRHLLNEKVRGKLIALDQPRIALVVKGRVDLDGNEESKDGYTIVLARLNLKPIVEYVDSLQVALQMLRNQH
ncbi:hypothetical protein [Streptomyces sp. NBC_00063]|uniref:hypothetical protein n=1 Tax=Streptomyces sp. NBC_00063 TaxID=2975638 RepID=UPI003D723677